MTQRRELPAGMTPRLLCREAAAAYLGISANHFEDHVAAAVPPVEIGKRKLWDVRALDRWLDRQSGFGDATRPIGEWLGALGDDRAR